MVKERKITKKDWDKVETFLNDELSRRKNLTFRKNAERVWAEVDRQIAMEAMKRVDDKGQEIKGSWHSALELGELSKASEIITSDVMRIMFPVDRRWFEPHVELEPMIDPQTGRPIKTPENKQRIADGLLRSLMAQQHKDFGLKPRVRLSIKEALHHGSFVSEVQWYSDMMVKDGAKIKQIAAPVWTPYSMWCAYPDPSPSITGTNLFYNGSMMLVEYMPKAKFKQISKGEGWMQKRIDEIPEDEHNVKGNKTKDLELVKFYGDICIDRSDGEIYLPNSKAILANGVLVYWNTIDLPYSPIIFSGYERQDVRDPYYTSPIIKQSPMQKITTVVANKFLDATALKVEPPIEYDGNDPDYVMNDGPLIAPGAKTPTKSMGQGMRALDIGNPDWALKALQMGLHQMQEGTGVNAVRSGMANSDRQTATEVQKIAQGAEVRTIEFIAQFEQQGLMPFLYMQHEFNRMNMKEYLFYSDEMNTPDFIRATNKDIQANAIFDVVGSKGILGEEQRTQRTTMVTAFASQNPLFAPKLKPTEILLDMYRDAGKKNPEEWVKAEEGPDPQMEMAKKQMQEQMQQMQQAIQKKEQELQTIEQQLQKKGNDVALKELKVQKDEEMLAMKKQLQDFMHGQKSKTLEEAEGEVEEKANEILSSADPLFTPAITELANQISQAFAQQAQVLNQIAQQQQATTQVQQQILAALETPTTVDIQRDKSGRITGAKAQKTLQ